MSSDAPLSRRFDAALLDLDGTVYLGGVVIPDVPAAVARAREDGMTCLFVTNNASRPPAVVAAALDAMGVPATADAVLTSPEAAADMVAAAHPQGSKVLVVGTDHITDCVRAVGLEPVHSADAQPVAIVQGLSQQIGWPELAEACIALRAGADWVATNVDATLPTDRGLLPGNGSLVAALERATGLHPRVAGKPQRPLIDSAIARAGSRRPLVVGDRLDTDIEAAVSAGVPALMPLTGVNTAVDLLVAPPARRPVFVSFDLRGLVVADRVVDLTDPAVGRG
ncbi:MAG: HAD hydrolase-like protein, partial [Williamsia herbipolensis]|nr:HAD hydrolase-like protein [Williamsia herbipolensis]